MRMQMRNLLSGTGTDIKDDSVSALYKVILRGNRLYGFEKADKFLFGRVYYKVVIVRISPLGQNQQMHGCRAK